MKTLKSLTLSLAALLVLGLATPSFAAEKEAKKEAKEGKEAKERTIKGEAKCAKCALHEADKCQTAIESENKAGKKVTYYLADNETAKNFHKEICKESKKVTATGTVKKGSDGKMELTASKIEEAK
ncbi:MAG: hypothetical protein JWM68_3128 [Verrucomicrobiales bacterium]|nr:hypothetical protein [Verrucomicrobiales bacterium]